MSDWREDPDGNLHCTISCEFTPGPDFYRAFQSEGGDSVVEIVGPRSWKDRLLSWPWRPWHNVWVATMSPTWIDTEYCDGDEATVYMTVSPHRVEVHTERRT